MDSLLAITQAVCDEVGLPRPISVVGNTDQTVRQLLALANREGKELAAKTSANEGWPQLRGEYQFDLTAYTGFTGDTTANSAVITNLNSTTNLAASQAWIGNGINISTHIQSVDSPTQITLDRPATTSATGVSFSASVDRYAFPSDLQYFIDRTGWDRSRKWELVGPITPQEWQFLKSGYPATGFLYRYRIMDSYIYFDPPPQVASRIALEYYSKNWCQSATGTGQAAWAADTDVPILQDELFVLGVKWRFLRAKGLDYAQEQRTYEDAVERIMARSAMSRDLQMNSTYSRVMRLVNYGNVPDTGMGS